ncbi:AGAP000116-PA-like protein [Anopheles sinensis]|uniref:AGAP000116-PA-like protein n=1 Tax=Anopheles sinensis TaxID=74873 RepID=A0A084VQB2_ANOSI|nr:AGAP000116-PA-like protein [Anopheles sinensis]
MWSPTHIQVTVQRAKGLLMKGKGGTNNCFVIIALGKEKYQTSIKEKAPESVIWNEECELQIPSQGNQAQLVLTALHRNTMGMDEFLGRVVLPLNEMDVYERPRSRWHKLESKDREKKKEKERGELEVRISFTVKAGSLTDLSKKEKSKSSISNLASSVGGSLLSIGAIEKRKGLKKIAKSIGSKMHISGLGKGKGGKESGSGGPADDGGSMYSGSYSSLSGMGASGSSAVTPVAGGGSLAGGRQSKQTFGDADPGVISEDEDEFVLDNLSHKSSNGSLNLRAAKSEERSPATLRQHPPNVPARTAHSLPSAEVGAAEVEKASPAPTPAASGTKVDEWEQKLYGRNHLLDIGSTDSLKRRSWESSRVMLSVQQEDQEQEAAEREATDGDVGQPRGQRGSMTAPTSPDLDGSAKAAAAAAASTPPKPLPRVGSQDTAVGRQSPAPEAKPEKESFTKKLKHFVKDRSSGAHRADSLENLSTAAATASVGGKKLAGKRQQGGGGVGSGSADQRIIIGGEHGGADGMTMASAAAAAAAQRQSKLAQVSPETLAKYEGKSREEVIRIAHNLESEVHYQKQKVKELEDYLDSLLLKVMECHPKILQNPYQKATPTKR